MTHGPVELSTERLLLRPFATTDVDDYYEYAAEPEGSRYVTRPQPFTRRRAEEDVAGSILNSWETLPSFVVVLANKVIGDVYLNIRRWNGASGVGDLGFFMAKSLWGKGLATEAATATVDLGFREYGLEKITAHSDPRNAAALRVVEKVGMKRDGVLRSHILRDSERVDLAVYSILREEWQQAEGASKA